MLSDYCKGLENPRIKMEDKADIVPMIRNVVEKVRFYDDRPNNYFVLLFLTHGELVDDLDSEWEAKKVRTRSARMNSLIAS